MSDFVSLQVQDILATAVLLEETTADGLDSTDPGLGTERLISFLEPNRAADRHRLRLRETIADIFADYTKFRMMNSYELLETRSWFRRILSLSRTTLLLCEMEEEQRTRSLIQRLWNDQKVPLLKPPDTYEESWTVLKSGKFICMIVLEYEKLTSFTLYQVAHVFLGVSMLLYYASKIHLHYLRDRGNDPRAEIIYKEVEKLMKLLRLETLARFIQSAVMDDRV